MAEKSPQKNVVVLGGSYAGISISHYLLKHILSDPSYHLTLVSASPQFFHRPASVRAVVSEKLLPSDKIFYDVADLFKNYSKDKFTFVHATATAMDASARTVTVTKPSGETEALNYYALVIATGTRATSPLLSLHTDTELIKNSWAKFREALSNAKSIIIAGGGPAGIETAGELGEYLNGRAGLFSSKLNNPKVHITVVTNDAKILPVLRPAIAAKAEKYLAKVGVSVIKGAKVESVMPVGAGLEDPLDNVATKATVTLSNGETKDADLYIPAMGVRPNTDFVPKDLLTDKGYVDVNGTTLRCDKAGERVYVLGDVGSYTRGGILDIYDAVPILATNIKRDLKSASSPPAANGEASTAKPAGQDRPYKPNLKETQLVPIGQSKGVGAVFGWKLPSFFIWAIKGRSYFTGSMTEDQLTGKKWEKESKWKLDA